MKEKNAIFDEAAENQTTSREEAIQAVNEIRHQAGLIDCDYGLVDQLADRVICFLSQNFIIEGSKEITAEDLAKLK